MKLVLLLLLATSLATAKRQEIKVVVVTMFERGDDTGDAPGELQFWVEREKLTRLLPLPSAEHGIRTDGKGILAIVTGVGAAKAAASVMALGLDPRFDLTRAYWLIAGIAGVDPADASLGSGAWATYVVDGDLAHEIDAREIPASWKTGYVPLGKATPYELPHREGATGEVYRLNPKLVAWAYRRTRDVHLDDSEAMCAKRAGMSGYPNAQRPPFVLEGDTLQASTFWHGWLMNRWANDWVAYHTGGKGNYVMTAMEDTGTLQSLSLLSRAGLADRDRILVLRAASNFDSPRPGLDAAASLAENRNGGFAGFVPALETAWKLGSTVVHELTANWKTYRLHPPE